MKFFFKHAIISGLTTKHQTFKHEHRVWTRSAISYADWDDGMLVLYDYFLCHQDDSP